MRAVDALEILELLGSEQRGLVLTAAAVRAGVSKLVLARLAERGTLRRVRHGVYALPSAGVDPLQDLRAAWLSASAGGDVVVSGASAAAVHRLGDLVPAVHELTAHKRRQTSLPDVRYRRAQLTVAEVSWIDGLPVTSVVRTIADLVSDATDGELLLGVLADAVDELNVDDIARVLDPAAVGYGFATGRNMLVATGRPYVVAAVTRDLSAAHSLKPELVEALQSLIAQPDDAEELVRMLQERLAA